MLAASTEASKREWFRVWDSGDARFVFSKNLFNLDAVEERIQGTNALREAVATSNSVTFLASLTSEERSSIQEFFTDATFFPELGASILAPDTTFMVEKLGRVELSDGVKSVEFDLPRPRGEAPPKGFFAKPATADQRSRLAEGVARRLVKPYKDILTFVVLQRDLASSKRARAISAFSEWLANDLERQTRAYQSARAALLAKAFPPGSLPDVGSSAALLDPPTQRMLQSMAGNFARYGIGSKSEFLSFVANAKVAKASGEVFVWVGIQGKGTFSVGTRVVRNP